MRGTRNMEAGPSANLLAVAVLQQAVAGACCATVKRHRTSSAAAVTPTELDEAPRFVRAADGGWAKPRRLWCDLAGVEPGWLERVTAEGSRNG